MFGVQKEGVEGKRICRGIGDLNGNVHKKRDSGVQFCRFPLTKCNECIKIITRYSYTREGVCEGTTSKREGEKL